MHKWLTHHLKHWQTSLYRKITAPSSMLNPQSPELTYLCGHLHQPLLLVVHPRKELFGQTKGPRFPLATYASNGWIEAAFLDSQSSWLGARTSVAWSRRRIMVLL
jgi:hypothetical protein